MDYEKIATSAIIESISKTNRLKAFVNTEDKEPSFDGHIYIYDNDKYTKDNIKRVAVQVKGKGVVSKAQPQIKYSISKIDLDNYMRNGGVIFFVVYIDKNTGDKKQIYYASLLPYKINELIKNNKNDKNIRVKLTAFPSAPDDITEIFLNFYPNAQKQISFAGKDLPTIEDLQKQGVLESVSFSYVSTKTNNNTTDFPKLLDGKELYFYANVKGGAAPIPVNYYAEVSKLHMSSTDDVSVTVKGKEYYKEIGKTITADKIIYRIGTSVTLTVPNESGSDELASEMKITLKINLKGTLKQRIKSLEFIVAMLEVKSFSLDGIPCPVTFSDEDWEKFNSKEYANVLTGYNRVLAVLEKMNVTKDVDVDKFTKDDYWKLDSLVAAIENETPIKNTKKDLPCIVNMNFGGLHLVMISKKQEDGSYKI